MNALQKIQAEFDAEPMPPPPPPTALRVTLPAGWLYAVLIGLTLLSLAELLLAAWWRA